MNKWIKLNYYDDQILFYIDAAAYKWIWLILLSVSAIKPWTSFRYIILELGYSKVKKSFWRKKQVIIAIDSKINHMHVDKL